MRNFNTNQTRFLYVAEGTSTASNLGISVGQAKSGEMYVQYKNSQGILTRSDTFDPKRISNLSYQTYDKLAQPLGAIAIQVDSTKFDVTASSSVGKAVTLNVTIHGVTDFDMDNSIVIPATVVIDSANGASTGKFLKALAQALVKALPPRNPEYPFIQVVLHKSGTDKVVTFKDEDSADFIDDATHLILVQGEQKYVLGKLSNEPCPFSVGTVVDDVYTTSNGYKFDAGVKDWLKVDKSNKLGILVKASDLLESGTTTVTNKAGVSLHLQSIPGVYTLADLEYFAAGEKGDMVRGYAYPNDYPFVPAVDLTKTYNVVSIEYYWNGGAEDIQKSPRAIQIAAPSTTTIAKDIYDQIDAARNGMASS